MKQFSNLIPVRGSGHIRFFRWCRASLLSLGRKGGNRRIDRIEQRPFIQ